MTLSKFILAITTILFVGCTIHSFFYIGFKKRTILYWILLPLFFAAMCAACLIENLAGMWVAIEATTLLSAPLICYHYTAESLEAMWKYLIICSIGIGLALFGTLLFMNGWYIPGFVFVLAGYGTKMGLAPFHTWLPDAHSEAPGPVSAFLSGALLNCSFLAITRFRDLLPEEHIVFADNAILALGLFSLFIAAVFIVRQTDYKRLLAYSSIEHMGLIAIMYSLHADDFFLQSHIAAHSLTKMMLFLVAGNLLLAYGTRNIASVHGLGRTMKLHAALWMLGILFICGMPPSALFFTEIGLVCSAPIWVASVVMTLLFVVFAGMSKVAIGMIFGQGDKLHSAEAKPISWTLSIVPVLALVVHFLVFAILFLCCFYA